MSIFLFMLAFVAFYLFMGTLSVFAMMVYSHKTGRGDYFIDRDKPVFFLLWPIAGTVGLIVISFSGLFRLLDDKARQIAKI